MPPCSRTARRSPGTTSCAVNRKRDARRTSHASRATCRPLRAGALRARAHHLQLAAQLHPRAVAARGPRGVAARARAPARRPLGRHARLRAVPVRAALPRVCVGSSCALAASCIAVRGYELCWRAPDCLMSMFRLPRLCTSAPFALRALRCLVVVSAAAAGACLPAAPSDAMPATSSAGVPRTQRRSLYVVAVLGHGQLRRARPRCRSSCRSLFAHPQRADRLGS